MKNNSANIYILEDPQRTKCYKKIIDICKKIMRGITINGWYDYNNNQILSGINNMKHCDAAIDLNYSNKRFFILVEITSLIHYCSEEDKLKESHNFFYNKQVIDNNTKIVPIIHYERKPGKPEAEKSIQLGRNKIIPMRCNENLIQVLSDYNLIRTP